MATEVLVLGGGFAGLSAAMTLSRRRTRASHLHVRLIDRLPHNVFLPLLPDLISGMVRPEHICHDLRPHCRRLGVEFVQAEVQHILPDEKRVVTDRGEFRGDFLVLALGSVTNYFGNDTVRQHTFGFKSIREALALAHEATALVEKAEADRTTHPDERAQVLIAGGGYSGFEIAGEIAKLIHVRTRHPYNRLREILRITVLEKDDTVLPHSSPRVRDWVVELMKNYEVTVRTGTTVDSFPAPRIVKLTDGTVLDDAMTIWTPGVRPAPVCDDVVSPRLRDHRFAVDPHLRLSDHPEIFAVGDVAGPIPAGKDQPLYMGVQFSLRAGHAAALNILRSIRKQPLVAFDPADLGYLVPLAPGRAAGEVLKHEVHGRLSYWMHYGLCIFRSWNWRNRWSVFWDFTFKNLMRWAEQRRRSVSKF